MLVGSDQNLAKIRGIPLLFLNRQPIKRVRVTKSLGVLIDERLSWSDHIDSIAKKISSAIAGLRQAGLLCHNDLQLFNTTFCLIIGTLFGTTCQYLVQAGYIQKLQNRSAGVITKQGYDVRSN